MVIFLASLLRADLLKDTEKFKNGDIIFIHSTSRQASAIQEVTGSRWTHMGILFKISNKEAEKVVSETEAGHWMVDESAGPVQLNPLDKFLNKSVGGYSVKRLRSVAINLNKAQELFNSGKSFRNKKGYDIYFVDLDGFCSGYVHNRMKNTLGITVGEIIPISSPKLKFDGPAATQILQERFDKKLAPFTREEWREKMTITPASIFDDKANLVEVGSFPHP